MMFDTHDGQGVRRFAAGLALLSLVSLAVTAWILSNVRNEQEIVARLMEHLPKSDLQAAKELSGNLSLQSSLSILLVLNVVATAIALAMVVRGYLSSERSLRDVKVLATDILASMDAGVITTDRTRKMTSINPSGRRLLGLSSEELDLHLADLHPEHALLDAIGAEVSKNHRPIRDCDYTIMRDGHRMTLRAGSTLLKDRLEKKIGLVLHIRDVTVKALMEERMRRMERFMGLGSLAAGLQHEIKNPLSALSLHVQLLCEHLEHESCDSETTELLDVITSEVKRITDVLDGFRNYASLTELRKAPVDVVELIEKLIRLLRPQAEKQHVKIGELVANPPLRMVQADSIRLEQVFLNLALNALAAMPAGGSLQFRVQEEKNLIRIDVADTGSGIPVEVQTRIFDPYFTTRNDGTGMGLALCDKIVRQHDGTIDFTTSAEGTVFMVRIPVES